MKTTYKSAFSLLLLLNYGATAYFLNHCETPIKLAHKKEIQTQTEITDHCPSRDTMAFLESTMLSQQLDLIRLKEQLASVKDDIKNAPQYLDDKDYSPIMHLLQKKKEGLEYQIKNLESSLPEQPEAIDLEDILQKTFTVAGGTFVAIALICAIIQSSRENGKYYAPSFTRLLKNIRG